MKLNLSSLAVILAIVATPVAAATGLRGIMKGWKADARTATDILSGRTKFDEAALRAALQNYVDEAGKVAGQVSGQNAEARDFKARFLRFQADAKAALGDAARPPAVKADFSRVAADCESCHNVYAN